VSQDGVKTTIYDVRFSEMDQQYRLIPSQLLSLSQDAMALDFAENGVAAFHLDKLGLSWILGEMSVRFEETLPFWKEKVVIKTWNSMAKGLKATREFIALNEENQVIAKGASTWFIINRESRRPILLKDFENALHISGGPAEARTDRPIQKPSVEDLKIEDSEAEKLLQKADFLREEYIPGQRSWALRRQARSSDIDFNGHVNNLRYVAGALETIPPEIRRGLYLESLYVKFTAEALLDDPVSSLCVMASKEKTFNHHLLSHDGSVQYSILQSRWGKKSC